jgi:hypothetical protein
MQMVSGGKRYTFPRRCLCERGRHAMCFQEVKLDPLLGQTPESLEAVALGLLVDVHLSIPFDRGQRVLQRQ